MPSDIPWSAEIALVLSLAWWDANHGSSFYPGPIFLSLIVQPSEKFCELPNFLSRNLSDAYNSVGNHWWLFVFKIRTARDQLRKTFPNLMAALIHTR